MFTILFSFSGIQSLIAKTGPGGSLPLAPQLSIDLDTLLAAQEIALQEELSNMLGAEPLATNVSPNDLPFSLTINNPGIRDDVRRIGQLSGEAKKAVDKAKSWIKQVEEKGAWVESFLSEQESKLPLGIKKSFGGVVAKLAIGQMRLLPTHTEVDVVLAVDIPGMDDQLLLGATGVKFSFQGGFTGDLKLELLADYGIDIAKGKSRLLFFAGSGEGGDGTYAIVTCDGVRELSVAASLILTRDWVVPVQDGQVLDDAAIAGEVAAAGAEEDAAAALTLDKEKSYRVHWDFSLLITPEDGFFVETGSSDVFAVTGYEDIHIHIQGVTLDYSDTRNPSGGFPEGYSSPFVSGGNASNLWRGVHIENISVSLPSKWSRSGNANPVEVYGQSIIIDKSGFTGLVGAKNLLPLNDGKAGGWAFSV
ncbi:MAG: hypothetical protein AAFU03_15900, partial [Bacteroidota bacterium]